MPGRKQNAFRLRMGSIVAGVGQRSKIFVRIGKCGALKSIIQLEREQSAGRGGYKTLGRLDGPLSLGRGRIVCYALNTPAVEAERKDGLSMVQKVLRDG